MRRGGTSLASLLIVVALSGGLSWAVVRGTVLDVAPYAPITWRDAGAAEGAPELPRRLVTFRTDEQLFGRRVGSTFSVIHTLPPAGAVLTEDPLYAPGEESLLFLQTALGPKGRSELPGAFSVVGIDGRYGVARMSPSQGSFDHRTSVNRRTGKARLSGAVIPLTGQRGGPVVAGRPLRPAAGRAARSGSGGRRGRGRAHRPAPAGPRSPRARGAGS